MRTWVRSDLPELLRTIQPTLSSVRGVGEGIVEGEAAEAMLAIPGRRSPNATL